LHRLLPVGLLQRRYPMQRLATQNNPRQPAFCNRHARLQRFIPKDDVIFIQAAKSPHPPIRRKPATQHNPYGKSRQIRLRRPRFLPDIAYPFLHLHPACGIVLNAMQTTSQCYFSEPSCLSLGLTKRRRTQDAPVAKSITMAEYSCLIKKCVNKVVY
jgi:hypothetical protein